MRGQLSAASETGGKDQSFPWRSIDCPEIPLRPQGASSSHTDPGVAAWPRCLPVA